MKPFTKKEKKRLTTPGIKLTSSEKERQSILFFNKVITKKDYEKAKNYV